MLCTCPWHAQGPFAKLCSGQVEKGVFKEKMLTLPILLMIVDVGVSTDPQALRPAWLEGISLQVDSCNGTRITCLGLGPCCTLCTKHGYTGRRCVCTQHLWCSLSGSVMCDDDSATQCASAVTFHRVLLSDRASAKPMNTQAWYGLCVHEGTHCVCWMGCGGTCLLKILFHVVPFVASVVQAHCVRAAHQRKANKAYPLTQMLDAVCLPHCADVVGPNQAFWAAPVLRHPTAPLPL